MAEGGQDLAFDFMKILLATGTGNYWPHFTNLIVVIKTKDGDQSRVIWKTKYQTSKTHGHTEIQMLNDKEFKGEVEKVKADKTKKVVISLTSNYSPCRKCADKLKEFYELEIEKSLIQGFTIRFSRLYRINEQDNKNGLKDLDIKGITLEAMTEKSWLDVLIIEDSWSDSMTIGKSSIEKIMKEKDWFDKVMKLFGLDPNKVRKRDQATCKELAELVMEALTDKVEENL